MTHLPARRRGAALMCLLLLCACSADGGRPASNAVQVQFKAVTDDSGNCRPERTIVAQTESSGLYAIRGEARYTLPEGTTELPFQVVFRGMDDRGFSDDDAVTILNHPGACAELAIDITIEKCEHVGEDKLDKTDCPEFALAGTEGFAAINLTRADGG